MTPVTVAVVSWNTRGLLLRCLDSLASEVQAGRAEVWVADNGSSDGSLAAVAERAPFARRLDLGENRGFGAAVNAVAQRTRSDWLLAANADVALEPGALPALMAAGAAPSVACVAPRLVLPDGTTQHSVHPFPTVGFTLAFNLGLHHLHHRWSERLCLEGFWDPDRARPVPWAIGACLLLRRRAFEEVGGFDERRWIYAEDLDLGWRLHDSGWIIRYEPTARVLHESGAATRRAFGEDRAVRFMTETYAVLSRRQGLVRTLLIGVVNVVGASIRVALMAPMAARSDHWRVRARASAGWLEAHGKGLMAGSRYARR